MCFEEKAVRFTCQSEDLFGILHIPQQPVQRGVLIIVGGPQYRVGSHRQFILLARHLAAQGIPVMRFDFRGMGDSDGDIRTFEHVGEDLRAAVEVFFKECPFLQNIVIWGLCDAASAALFYAHQDKRVSGLVLLNPWVRTEQGIAKAYLKHYYLQRLLAPEFWQKLLIGRLNPLVSVQSLYKLIKSSLMSGKEKVEPEEKRVNFSCDVTAPLPVRMLFGIQRFQGKTLIITSGKDLTAQEFLDLVGSSADWQSAMKEKQVENFHIKEANHTFSTHAWRDQVAKVTADRVLSW